MGGYVYLILDTNKSIYKIGVTRKMNDKRIKSLQSGNSGELQMLKYYFCNYPFRLEKMIHQHFREVRELGEWFKLTPEDVDDFKNLCQKYDKVISELSDNPFFMKDIH